MKLNNLSRQMTMTCRYLAISLFVLTLSATIQPPVSANGNFDVQTEGELITIQSDNASLIAVVDRLSELIEIPITYTDGSDVAVSLNIIEEPLEQVVEKLSKNSMVVRKTVDGEEIIAEIVVLLEGEAGGGSTANLPTGEPAEGIIAGQEPVDPTAPTMGAAMPEQPELNDQGVPAGHATDEQLIDDSAHAEPTLAEDGTVIQ